MSCTATVNDPHNPTLCPRGSRSTTPPSMTRTAPRRPRSRSKRHSPMSGSWSKGTVCMWSGLSTMTSWQLAIHVATLVIAPRDYVHADPARGAHQADNA
jgi:hypothetical protein